jgi:hypothetical protein
MNDTVNDNDNGVMMPSPDHGIFATLQETPSLVYLFIFFFFKKKR